MAAVASVCPNRFTLPSGLTMPYCSNLSLDEADPDVTRAVIVVHGTGRNGPGYFQSLRSAATTAGKLAETIIVAPHFVTEEDINARAPGVGVPFWTNDGWKQGDPSLSTSSNPRPATTSSFDVLDAISARLDDNAFFPNLRLLVIAGHSAGGQFVNRYAAAHRASVPTRYVVANPSTYMYMDDQRRIAGTVDQFAVPDHASCPRYNHYKHGLQGLNPYMAARGAAALRADYATHEVVYLLGSADNDPNHGQLERDCEDMMQGDHRLERGTVYFNHVQHVYGPSVLAKHSLVEVAGVGHDGGDMFRSPEGVAVLFPPIHVLADPQPTSVLHAVTMLLFDDAAARAQTAPLDDEITHYPATAVPGAIIEGLIELVEPAPDGGRVVVMTSERASQVGVGNVVVPRGAKQGRFAIRIAPDAAGTSAIVTARSGFIKQTEIVVTDRGVRHVDLGRRDGFDAAVLAVAATPSFVYATHYEVDSDNRSERPGDVVTLRADDLTATSRVPVGFMPRNMRLNPDTHRLYVANFGKESYSLTVLDLADPARPTTTATLRLGQVPIDIAVDPLHDRVFVSNPFQGRIHVIDGATTTTLPPIDVGAGVHNLAMDTAGRRLFTTQIRHTANGPNHGVGVIRIHDDGTYEALASTPWPVANTQPLAITVDDLTRTVYVTALGSPGGPPCVAVLDADTLALRHTVRTVANPHAVVVDSKRRQLHIGTDAGLQIVDLTTDRIVSTVPKVAAWSVTVNDESGDVWFGSGRQGTLSNIAAPELATLTRWTSIGAATSATLDNDSAPR